MRSSRLYAPIVLVKIEQSHLPAKQPLIDWALPAGRFAAGMTVIGQAVLKHWRTGPLLIYAAICAKCSDDGQSGQH